MAHKYIYDDTPIKAGDVVEFYNKMKYNDQYKNGRVYLVKNTDNSISTELDDRESTNNGMGHVNFRKVKTLPGTKHVKGDLVICIGKKGEGIGKTIVGKTYTSQDSRQDHIFWDPVRKYSRHSNEFLVVMKTNNVNNE